MPNTMTLISGYTVGAGGAADITFSSIPSTYTDLVVKFSAATNRATNDTFRLTFNGSGSGYSGKILYGNGSAAASFSSSTSYISDLSANGTNYSNVFASDEIYIPNYAGNSNKSMSIDSTTEANAAGSEMTMIAGLWSNTAAITSIKIAPNVGSLIIQYSTAYLYGIKNS